MFVTLPANAKRSGRKFQVRKREADGFVHNIGLVVADNKEQADYRARALFGKRLDANEAVWAEDPDPRFLLNK